MEEINIIYIDDKIDEGISYYLNETFETDLALTRINEFQFNTGEDYSKLLSLKDIKTADVIIIDSRLFENGDANAGKFTGEEFKIILKKVFPYKEVIVATQNEPEEGFEILPKFNSYAGGEAQDFYDKHWKDTIERAIKNVLVFRKLLEKLKKNDGIQKVLIERIINSINGSDEYDELKVEDINSIIDTFREIQRRYDD